MKFRVGDVVRYEGTVTAAGEDWFEVDGMYRTSRGFTLVSRPEPPITVGQKWRGRMTNRIVEIVAIHNGHIGYNLCGEYRWTSERIFKQSFEFVS